MMEPTNQIILESLPPKSPRSKLEPHRELIRELRRKGRTYREVALLFPMALAPIFGSNRMRSNKSAGSVNVEIRRNTRFWVNFLNADAGLHRHQEPESWEHSSVVGTAMSARKNIVVARDDCFREIADCLNIFGNGSRWIQHCCTNCEQDQEK